jgi:hypothetical protein
MRNMLRNMVGAFSPCKVELHFAGFQIFCYIPLEYMNSLLAIFLPVSACYHDASIGYLD